MFQRIAVTAAVFALAGGRSGGAQEVPAATLRVVERAQAALLGLEEPHSPGEWPYEAVLRDQGAIPIGYRVGGTGYVVKALAALPALDVHPDRRAALGRGMRYLVHVLDEPGMSGNVQPGYDVRLWGFLTGAGGLLAARAAGEGGDLGSEELDRALRTYLSRIAALEIPISGGWTYDRPRGRLLPAPAQSYVTAEVLLVLFEAASQGFEVDAASIARALDVLEAQRTETGGFTYAAGDRKSGAVPGSVGRMLVCELALYGAGRSDRLHVRGAVDAFFAHWDLLDARRGRSGTGGQSAFGVGPHYFLYAHAHASRAIELLPEPERAEYRARLARKLLSVRDEASDTWNDRVFRRAAGYGTAAATLALTAPLLGPLASWEPVLADPPASEER